MKDASVFLITPANYSGIGVTRCFLQISLFLRCSLLCGVLEGEIYLNMIQLYFHFANDLCAIRQRRKCAMGKTFM